MTKVKSRQDQQPKEIYKHKDIETMIKSLPTKKSPDLNGLTTEL